MSKDIASVLQIQSKQISSNSGQQEQLTSPLIPSKDLAPVQEETVSNTDYLYSNEMADFSKNSTFDQMNTVIPKDISVAPRFARRPRRATYNEPD